MANFNLPPEFKVELNRPSPGANLRHVLSFSAASGARMRPYLNRKTGASFFAAALALGFVVMKGHVDPAAAPAVAAPEVATIAAPAPAPVPAPPPPVVAPPPPVKPDVIAQKVSAPDPIDRATTGAILPTPPHHHKHHPLKKPLATPN